jgi:hypothetical protein
MASIISTKTSGGGGIAVTGDTSGVLELQSNNGTTAVTIDASQNVGIGTASPATKFNVSSTGQLVAKFQSTSTGLYDGACVYLNSSGGTDNQGTYLYHGIENAGDSTNTTFQLQQRGNSGTYVRTMYLVDYKNQFQYWATSGTERMRIDASGNVLVGASTAYAPFSVQGTSSGGTAWFRHAGNNSFGTIATFETYSGSDLPMISFKAYNGGSPNSTGIRGLAAGGIGIMKGGSSGGFGNTMAEFLSTGGDVLKMYANRAGSGSYFYYNTSNGYGTTSDARTKYDIRAINTSEALSYIMRLSPSEFKMNDGNGKLQAGFIAQECLTASENETQKSAVANYDTYVQDDQDCPYLGVSDRPLLAHAIAAIQEQQAIITDLKARIEVLEAK